MPTFGRTESGKWHIVGPDGCRYGRAFADETENVSDESVTASDIVAYDPPDSSGDNQSRSISSSGKDGSLLQSEKDTQRLILPFTVRESDSELCRSCRLQLERHQKRRLRVITQLKQVTPLRDGDWNPLEQETRRPCDWCRAHEFTTWHTNKLNCTVCPACGRLFETPFGEPTAENQPEANRVPNTPTEPVVPIVFGTTLSDYDPTGLVGSNRPLIKYRNKHKYAELVLELERTGHGFSAEGIAALDEIRSNYANQVADDNTHQTDVTLEVGVTPRTITIKGIFPEDSSSMIGSCWDIVSDPTKWFPIGWPEQGWIHRRSADPAIPGDEPVVDAFPRLQTQTPAHSVDLETLREVTEPGRYERGSRYYERGSVTNIEYIDDSLQATVQGSRPYTVQVTLSEGSYASGRCSCPDDTVPCKHIVAAVLASGDVEPVGSGQSIDTLLETISAKELRTVLTELADEDLQLRKRLYEKLGED